MMNKKELIEKTLDDPRVKFFTKGLEEKDIEAIKKIIENVITPIADAFGNLKNG